MFAINVNVMPRFHFPRYLQIRKKFCPIWPCVSTDTLKYGDFGIRTLERIFLTTEKFKCAAYQWKHSHLDILEDAVTSTTIFD